MQADETLALKPTRASFIRSLPEAMPVDEVIERGREIGLVINPSDVHSVRYYMRQVGKAQPARKTASPTATLPGSPTGTLPTLPTLPNTTSTATTLERGIAATVKRNYELIEAQQADESAPRSKSSPAPIAFGKKKRGSNGAEPVTRSQPIVKERTKRAPIVTDVRAMENQVRFIASRIGTDRVREILEELEALPIE